MSAVSRNMGVAILSKEGFIQVSDEVPMEYQRTGSNVWGAQPVWSTPVHCEIVDRIE